MNIRRILLWGLPLLFAVVVIVFVAILPPYLERQDKSYQTQRQRGWTTYLQEYSTSTVAGDLGERSGDLAADSSGRIWAAGGNAVLEGLHMFDGAKWTSYPEHSSDLAISPDGTVYAAAGGPPDALRLFDGQTWRTYSPEQLEIVGWTTQVEVDSNGRVWAVVEDFGYQLVAEIVVEEGKLIVPFPDEEFPGGEDVIRSMDADKQGRIWAAVEGDGLHVFDGNRWQRLPGKGQDLTQVVRTTFDDQGRAWIATECGGVLRYDGQNWETVVSEDTNPGCKFSQKLEGITLDREGSLWGWSSGRVAVLKDGKWVVFTPENSGVGDDVFGVLVDKQNRVWVGSREGISKINKGEAQPLAQGIVDQHRRLQRLNGMMSWLGWFVPAMVAVAWAAVSLNSLITGAWRRRTVAGLEAETQVQVDQNPRVPETFVLTFASLASVPLLLLLLTLITSLINALFGGEPVWLEALWEFLGDNLVGYSSGRMVWLLGALFGVASLLTGLGVLASKGDKIRRRIGIAGVCFGLIGILANLFVLVATNP